MAFLSRHKRSSRDDFAREMARLVREITGVKPQIRPDFSLSIVSRDVTMNLENIFAECARREPAERLELMRRAIRGVFDHPPKPTTWAEAAPRLMPAVRATSVAALAGRDGAIRRQLVPFVQLMCAIDFPDSMTFATESDLKTWGVSQTEAEQAAGANLVANAIDLAVVGPVATILGPDGYCTSWLATPATLWPMVSKLFGHDSVIIPVSRDHVKIVDTSDPKVICRQLTDALAAFPEEPRQVSPVPYLIREDHIETWDPPPDHPAVPLIQHAERLLALVEYERQKDVLQGLSDKTGEDVFVGGYVLMERPDGSVWSWTGWSSRVTNGLMPQADYICAGTDEQAADMFFVPWKSAMAIAGEYLVREPGYDPPRWRYRGWPDATTMNLLRKQAVDPTKS
ncbi:MAG: hypothetical protein J2P57_02975 [Acidimicrobiaceae bacterium]|nr:hypothetical protein [Acidimicrobiaceae bacterium]